MVFNWGCFSFFKPLRRFAGVGGSCFKLVSTEAQGACRENLGRRKLCFSAFINTVAFCFSSFETESHYGSPCLT